MKLLFYLMGTFLSISLLSGQKSLVTTIGQGMTDTGSVASNHFIGFFSADNHFGFRSRTNEIGFSASSNTNVGFSATGSLDGIYLGNNLYGVHSENNVDGIYSTGNQNRAALFIGDTNSTFPAVELLHENDSLADLHFGGTARITSEDEKGLSLPATNRPLITREWNPFSSGDYIGIGRWGLFMEPSRMVLGIPNIDNREIEFAKYNIDGTRVKLAGINQAGEVCATAHTTCSDIRYKRSVNTLNNSLAKIKSLRGVTYYWDQDRWEDQFSPNKQIGFIAQEVEEVFPELVSTDANGYKSVAYDKITPILVEAVKEQQREIEELKKLVNELISKER